MDTLKYGCDRGATVWATYVNGTDGSFAVISVEGQQVALSQAMSASGVRYVQNPDAAGYVWWTKGDEAFLTWEDVPNGTDETLLSQCMAQ